MPQKRSRAEQQKGGVTVQCLHWCRMQVQLPRQCYLQERNRTQKRGGGVHAGGTLLKHLNVIAGHTFSKRESKSLVDRIREEMRHRKSHKKRKREKAVSLPNMIKAERMGCGSSRRVESLRSF